ncbi:MAG: response regulator, partial [Anaerolineales bacterium]
DDDLIRSLVKTRLKKDYEVFTAQDGEEAVVLARRLQPDLLICDLMMPKLHGFAVMQELRADDKLRTLRIIVSSAKAYPADQKTALELGADAYMTKPFDIEVLAAKVNELLASGGEAPILVRFWGTRGSIATPGPKTTKYGGNTACTEVRYRDELIVFDAGTGARELGLAWTEEFKDKPIEGHIFIGHSHWDHIQGFPFFTPAYQAGNAFTIYSVRGAQRSLEKVFTGQMDRDYFPVALGDMQAKLRFVELDGPVEIADARISFTYLNHPGLAIGFRMDAGKKTLVYISDNEPYQRLVAEDSLLEKLDQNLVEFTRQATLLICEAQYTDEEYKQKRGWGHSALSDVLELALAAQVKQLALFHHDPMHTDEMIDVMVEECQEKLRVRGAPLTCFGACEGLTLTI